MNSFQILLNNKFTGSTQSGVSGLDLVNDYYVYVNKNGGGIVNPYNVRGYLNDPKNTQITNDFLTFLTGSTTQDQYLNILTSDKKLANTFNVYFQNLILTSTSQSNTSVVQQNLTGATQISVQTFSHPWSGYAPSKQLTGITQDIYGSEISTHIENVWSEFTTEESYFLPIKLNLETKQISRNKFEACDLFINKKTAPFYPEFSAITDVYLTPTIETGNTRLNTLVNCFVDLNLETNENFTVQNKLLTVSFDSDNYLVREGDTFSIKISLSQPSNLGIEEATVDLFYGNPAVSLVASNQASILDFNSEDLYPLTLTWATGEQDKFLSFTAKTDFLIEELEQFKIQISNIINLDPGTILNADINIEDTTILRLVSLEIQSAPTGVDEIGHGVIDEGDAIEMVIRLDGPAFGVESIILDNVLSVTTSGNTFGPAVNPLMPSDYTLGFTATPTTPFSALTVPVTLNFAVGETYKTISLFSKNNNIINPHKIAYFQLRSQQQCLIDQTKKSVEITVEDNDGTYKYVHLNLGTIYSEFGNSSEKTLMRQINPQPAAFGGGYNNISVNEYNNDLITYGSSITFRDYSRTNTDTIQFSSNEVKVKITNLGTFQALINNNPVNTGQSITINVPVNNYIITATTNINKNTVTDLYENANYKIELINNYSGLTTTGALVNGMGFNLRDSDNVSQSTTKKINLGTFLFSGNSIVPEDISNQYKLKSKYTQVNTARVQEPVFGGGTALSCPTVASFSNSVSFSEFNVQTFENISVLGIIFLNYNSIIGANYTGNIVSKYNGFDFVTGTLSNTCPQTNSSYNGLNYISLPFHLEP